MIKVLQWTVPLPFPFLSLTMNIPLAFFLSESYNEHSPCRFPFWVFKWTFPLPFPCVLQWTFPLSFPFLSLTMNIPLTFSLCLTMNIPLTFSLCLKWTFPLSFPFLSLTIHIPLGFSLSESYNEHSPYLFPFWVLQCLVQRACNATCELCLRRDAVLPFSILLTPKRVEARGLFELTLALTPLKSTSLRDRTMCMGVLGLHGTFTSANQPKRWSTQTKETVRLKNMKRVTAGVIPVLKEIHGLEIKGSKKKPNCKKVKL